MITDDFETLSEMHHMLSAKHGSFPKLKAKHFAKFLAELKLFANRFTDQSFEDILDRFAELRADVCY